MQRIIDHRSMDAVEIVSNMKAVKFSARGLFGFRPWIHRFYTGGSVSLELFPGIQNVSVYAMDITC